MNVSIIVAIYKDIEALDLILSSLYAQTYRGEYEVIVAEDGQNENVKKYIDTLDYKNLIHATQKDEGWRKNKSLNNAIRHSSGELIIFLDGDCIPYNNLVENYVKLKKDKTVLCGRRVELGEVYSSKLRDKTLKFKVFEKSYLKLFFKLNKDNTRHYEEGIVLNNFLFNMKYKNKNSHILGCNFAVNRVDLASINGFNEDYHWPSVGEDTDIEYRLKNNGCFIKTARNRCNIIHLFHKETYDNDKYLSSLNIFNNTKDITFTKNGIEN